MVAALRAALQERLLIIDASAPSSLAASGLGCSRDPLS